MRVPSRVPRALAALAGIALALAGCSGGSGSGEQTPAISVSSATLAFSATVGGTEPAPQSFAVTNGGGSELARPSLAIVPASATSWLSASVTGERAPFTVTVQPSAGALPPGNYSATIQVRSNGASNTPQSVGVSLVVSLGGPVVQLSTRSVDVVARSHGPELVAPPVTVTNGGGGVLDPPTIAAVTYGGGPGGWLVPEIAESAPYVVTLRLRPTFAGLGAGTYEATVTVSSPNAVGPPASLSVTLSLTPTWTVFVYGHGDNGRSTSLVSAIAQMSQANLGNSVNVVVAADYSAGRTAPIGAYATGTELLRIRGAGDPPELLYRSPEDDDFDDPAVLSRLLSDMLPAFPADHYAVVLWGGGGSWLGGFGGDEHDTPGSTADDGVPMTPAEVAAGIASGVGGIGFGLPIDLVGFDGAPMMGHEVAFELRDVARTFVAGAEAAPGAGWDWATTLGRLASNPAMSAEDLAASVVQDWDARQSGRPDALVRAYAALDLTQLPGYADAWNALASAMVHPEATVDWLAVARTQFGAAPGYGLDDPRDPEVQPSLRDAGQFLDGLALLESDSVVAGAAFDVRQALESVVLRRALGTRRGAQAGIQVEAALGSRWPARWAPYASLDWNTATRWGDVLWSINGAAHPDPPMATTFVENTTDPTMQEPPIVHLVSSAPDLGAARLFVGWKAPGGIVTSYGLVLEDGAAPFDLPWDGNLPQLSDGTHTSPVLIQPWIADAVWLLPGTLRDGAASVEAYALAVAGSSVVDAVALRVNGALSVLPLSDFRGLQFTPTLFRESDGQWLPATTLDIPWSESASLTFERLSAPAGTYTLRATLTDVWGNVASSRHDVTVVTPFGR